MNKKFDQVQLNYIELFTANSKYQLSSALVTSNLTLIINT